MLGLHFILGQARAASASRSCQTLGGTSMRAEVTPHTLDEIVDNYDAAVKWVESAGFPVDRGRHSDYQKTITTLQRQFPVKGWGDFADDIYRDRICTALLESREFVSIFRGLSASTDSSAVENLRHYIKGPALPTLEQAENSSNRARNYGFELYLNALFAHAGLRPEYGTNADLSFSIDQLRVFVEAKRPMTSQSIDNSLRVAIRQLVTRLKVHEAADRAGIIALDLSKVINPENRVLSVRNEGHLYQLMYAEDKLQLAKAFPTITKNLKPGIVGLLLHYRLLCSFQPSGSLNTLKWIGWVPFLEEPRLTDILLRLVKAVRAIC